MLIFSEQKLKAEECSKLWVDTLVLWKSFPKISTAGLLNRNGLYPYEYGREIGYAVVSEELGVLARYESREDAYEAILCASRQAARGDLVEFHTSDLYLASYPQDEYNYAD